MGWQLFVTGVEGKTAVLRNIDPNCSIDDLLAKIAETQGNPDGDMRVLFGTKQLTQGKGQVLSDYKIVDMSTLFIVLRLRGGSSPQLTALPGYIELTTDPCMISFDDDRSTMRAKMPCGHVIAADSMSQYARSILKDGFYSFHCPDSKCKTEWPYFLIRHVADLSHEEQQQIEVKLAENYSQKAMGVQQCPSCQSFCMRHDKQYNCVQCPVCLKKKQPCEFCWSCLHPWRSHAKIGKQCGNLDCEGEDPRVSYLRECPKTEIYGVQSPSIRSCPGCGILIHHIEGCKHMQCTGCKCQFCFVCLRKPDGKGKWQCGSYNSACTPAAIQSELIS